MAVRTADMTGLDDRDHNVLQVLAGGRSNPYLIREETGLGKGDVNTALTRLGKRGYARQVTKGLYEITDTGQRELKGVERYEDEREDRHLRNHDVYREDHWKVIDIDGVDKVFATPTGSGQESVRMDIDGFASQSSMRDLANEGENVNSSIFVPLPEAVELKEQLEEAIEDARE